MAGQLLLINPRKRGTKRRAGAKRRTAAQRAATARMLAANRARRAGGGHKKRRSTAVAKRASYARNPITRHVHHRRRRNPISMGTATLGFTGAKLMAAAKTAGIAAGGALAIDYVYGFLRTYLPASVQTPVDSTGAMNPLYFLAKGLTAVALGVFGAKAVGAKTATKMAEGSLVITAYSALRNVLPASITGSLGYYQPAATDGPNLPGQVNQPMRGSGNGSITDLRAYLGGQGAGRNTRARTAYDNPGMAGMNAYLGARR